MKYSTICSPIVDPSFQIPLTFGSMTSRFIVLPFHQLFTNCFGVMSISFSRIWSLIRTQVQRKMLHPNQICFQLTDKRRIRRLRISCSKGIRLMSSHLRARYSSTRNSSELWLIKSLSTNIKLPIM